MVKVSMVEVFVLVLIVGTILIVLLTVALSSQSVKNKKKPKSIYFAMYLGDMGNETTSRFLKKSTNSSECSLELNMNNTRESIEVMRNRTFRYGFILYTNAARTTSPLKALDAIASMGSIEPDMAAKKFIQSEAIEEFSNQYNEHNDSILIYYVPCKYDYNQNDNDTQLFVEIMDRNGLRNRTMIISNTNTTLAVAKAYRHPKEQIVGKDESEDIIEKIVSFATSSRKYFSPTSSTMLRTSDWTTLSTGESKATSPLKSTFLTTLSSSTLTPVATSTPTTLPTSMTTTAEPTKTHNAHCVIVVDLYNFGKDESKYNQEKQFVKKLGASFFNSSGNLTAGLAIYGYVSMLPINLIPALNSMTSSPESFNKELDKEIWLRDTDEPSDTTEAIQEINDFKKVKGRANCLIFISAHSILRINTEGLPPLDPPQDWERIVAVGFNGTDLSKVAVPPRGKAVSVPYSFAAENVEDVVDGVFEVL
ncbi:hypothetical protein Aduo_006833 [Ancylostoma duodenale]